MAVNVQAVTEAAFRQMSVRRLHLLSGLVLGAYLVCHFVNHMLGLVSLEAMEAARPWLSGLWRTPAGTVALYGSVVVHFALALQALYRRRTLSMTAKEAGQMLLGLALPFLLVGHVVGTRIDFALTGTERTYPQVVAALWIANPSLGARQILALLIAWLHFCLGIYFWLRAKDGFERYRMTLFAVGLLVPLLSILGFAAAGRELELQPWALPPRSNSSVPEWIEQALMIAFAAPVALVLGARGLRHLGNRRDRVRIGYPDGRFVEVERGFSVLEASRSARIPHQAVCGGRARCSTCRIEILRGNHGQPPPDETERATLARIGASPRVRLACQFRPVRNVEVAPLVTAPATIDETLGSGEGDASSGEEREIVVLFCDIRGFTRFAEDRLPYDVVFLLNRYFELVARAVTENGGVVDKFVGDGAMALFGLSGAPKEAPAQALAAAERILVDLDRLNEVLGRELREPVRVAVAIHGGPAIVGRIGYGKAAGVTAVGDTINVASRLEGLAKDANAEIIVSDTVMGSAARAAHGYEPRTLEIRGRSVPLKVWLKPPRKR